MANWIVLITQLFYVGFTLSALTYCFNLFPLAFLQCCFAFYCGAVQVWQFLVLHFFHWIFAVLLLWWILFKVGRSPLHFFALVDFVQSGAIYRSSRSPIALPGAQHSLWNSLQKLDESFVQNARHGKSFCNEFHNSHHSSHISKEFCTNKL